MSQEVAEIRVAKDFEAWIKAVKESPELYKNVQVYLEMKSQLKDGNWALFYDSKLIEETSDHFKLLKTMSQNYTTWNFEKVFLVCVGHEADVKEVNVIQGQVMRFPGSPAPVLTLRLPVCGPNTRQEILFKVDTGAMATTLPKQDIINLALNPAGTGIYGGAFAAAAPRSEYFAHVDFEGHPLPCYPVLESESRLLGTNILQFLRLQVNGTQVWATLELERL